MNEASDVTDINEEQLDLAIRKRIQSVALCHLVDDNIDGVSAFRFKAAGTFESDLTRNNPCDTAELIADPTHERRIGEEDSLLIFVKDVQEPMSAGVIDLSDHLLESDIEIRRASLEAISRLRSLMLPCTAKIIVDSTDQILSDDEDKRLPAALRAYDKLNNDFMLNIAGLRKCCEFQYDEYDKFYRRVFRPEVGILNSFTPPLVRFKGQSKEIESWVSTWRNLNIDEAIRQYDQTCGYLPPAIALSATSLLEKPDQHLGEELFRILASSDNCKTRYHALLLCCDNPELIKSDQVEKFESLVLETLSITKRSIPQDVEESSSEEVGWWDSLYDLARLYLAHLESTVPSVDSRIMVAYAWWMAEQVTSKFFFFNDAPLSLASKIFREESDIAIGKWSFSRTAMSPSSARKDMIFTASIWSDSLLSTIIHRWEKISEFTSTDFCDRIFELVQNAMVMNRFNLADANEKEFLVDELEFEKIKWFAQTRSGEKAKGLESLVSASELINQVDGMNTLLSEFTDQSSIFHSYACYALQARQYAGRDAGEVPVEFLSNNEWIRAAFLKSSDVALGMLVAFLTEWQLSRNDEWRVRFSHILAAMSLEADSPSRKEVLFELCLRSAINVDISSPIERLLCSDQKKDYLKFAETWNGRLGFFAYNSAAWAAYRIRGFQAKIQRFLPTSK